MPSDPVSVLLSDLTVGSCPCEGRRRCCSRPQPCLHASTLAIANSALLLPWMQIRTLVGFHIRHTLELVLELGRQGVRKQLFHK